VTLRKKLAAVLTAAGLAAGLSLAGTGTARADITPPPVGQWKGIANPHLNGRGTLLCFEDPGGSTANGARSQLGYCHPYNSDGTLQRWVFIPVLDSNGNPVTEGGNKLYELWNQAAGRCLVANATGVGQPLILAGCDTNSTQIDLWELRPTGGGPANQDFQLALWLFDDWCIGANIADDIVPNGLQLDGCNTNDARQLWELW
jgi:hypothetical protein